MHAANDDDPTKMINQPSLQRSSGTIWLVMGAFFLVASLIPLGALAFVRQGASAPLALVLMCGVAGLYLAMGVVRIAVRTRVLRLRTMATLMIAMAALALIGLIACAGIERAAITHSVAAGLMTAIDPLSFFTMSAPAG